MKEIKVSYNPTAKQLEAHSALDRYILYGGAVGGGKTWWLCGEAIKQSVKYSGNHGLICRHRLTDLTATTLRTLQLLLPGSLIERHHQTNRIFELKNGSTIRYTGLGDYETTKEILSGLELGWFCVDQAEELTENQFNLLCTRLRLNIPGIHYHGFLTANPEPGWLRDRFIDNKLDDHCFIPALPTDNPHLPPDYIAELRKTLPEAMIKKLLEGNWDIDAAANYLIPYSAIREAIKRTIEAKGVKVAGVDIARYGDDETVFLLRQGNKTLHIESWAHQDTTFSAGRVASLIRKFRPEITYIDSIGVGAGVFDPLRNEGFAVRSVNVGEAPFDKEQYFNRRAEYYNLLAKKFREEEMDIPDDPRLASQLASIKYKYRGTKMLIESKEVMRKEMGVKSPDIADALMLAFIDVSPELANIIPVKHFG